MSSKTEIKCFGCGDAIGYLIEHDFGAWGCDPPEDTLPESIHFDENSNPFCEECWEKKESEKDEELVRAMEEEKAQEAKDLIFRCSNCRSVLDPVRVMINGTYQIYRRCPICDSYCFPEPSKKKKKKRFGF